MRIWGAWSANDDINSYADAPDQDQQNNEYTAGTGWDQVCHTFSTSFDNWEPGEALVIQARLYSSSSGPDPAKYFIDLVSVETASSTATIHFPAPVNVDGLIADAGDNQTVDAGDPVTLDGSESMNTDGDIAAYFWEQTSGVTVNLDDEEAMTTTFTAPNESSVLGFDLTVYDANGNESTDSVTITVIASAGNLTISEIQGQVDTSPYVDQYVSTSGTITAVVPGSAAGFFIQDNQDLWSGLWIIDFGSNIVDIGDLVEVSGTVEEWFDLTQINIASAGSSFTLLDTEQTGYDPTVVSSLSEEHESILVTVSGVCSSLPTDANYGEWLLDNEGTEIMIQNVIFDFMPEIGQSYTITGPATYTYSHYKVYPRNANDIEEGILKNSELIQDFSILEAYPNPFNPVISIEFSTIETQNVQVFVYDLMGNKIEILFDGLSQSNVLNTLTWDASRYSSGDYFIHLASDKFSRTNKITLMK